MADEQEFMVGLLKGIQTNIAELGRRMDRVDARLTGIEDRLERVGQRQTAAMHMEQSLLTELIGINARLDNMSAEMLGVDRRLTAFEGRA